MGESGRAEALLDAIPVHEPVGYYDNFCWSVRARLALSRNQPALALQLIERCSRPFVAADQGNWIALSLRQTQGEALAALDDPQAEPVLQSMCRLAERKGIRPLLWRGRIALGKYLLGKKRVSDAEDEFARARILIDELAAGVVDETVRATFRQRALGMIPYVASPTPRQAAKRAYDGLTAAEQQVAALVAQGKSNREIAAAQVISIKTAEAHISHILAKLGFTSRAQIAVWAVEKGLTATAQSDTVHRGEDGL
jgi:DNA-binding CsgD family transcriptional regulator